MFVPGWFNNYKQTLSAQLKDQARLRSIQTSCLVVPRSTGSSTRGSPSRSSKWSLTRKSCVGRLHSLSETSTVSGYAVPLFFESRVHDVCLLSRISYNIDIIAQIVVDKVVETTDSEKDVMTNMTSHSIKLICFAMISFLWMPVKYTRCRRIFRCIPALGDNSLHTREGCKLIPARTHCAVQAILPTNSNIFMLADVHDLFLCCRWAYSPLTWRSRL